MPSNAGPGLRAREYRGTGAEGAGLVAQREAILRECQGRGWHLVDVIEDEGCSAKDLRRPGIKIALE